MTENGPPPRVSPGEVTLLLRAWSKGDVYAAERLMPLVYAELRRLAASQMRRERSDHTLQPTALVHEAYVKLVDQHLAWKDRSHFFGVAARAMRQVLVDHARRKHARKRSGGFEVPIESAEPSVPPRALDLLALDQALHRLAEFDARQAHLVELRVFAGLTVEEIAKAMDCSPATASRDYRHAEAWLRRQMRTA
ncbi:MAG: ECF-type sigma factor [Thermoanaerobaculia bacterium]|nr:ECF-type sigma factor [Thermoanaerobaculia bacterium]